MGSTPGEYDVSGATMKRSCPKCGRTTLKYRCPLCDLPTMRLKYNEL